MWDEIIHPFPNVNNAIWERMSNLYHNWCARDYLSMLELKLIHVGKKGPLGNISVCESQAT